MGKKNVITKEYMRENTKFADICNYYLYNGAEIIKPEDLVETDVTELALPTGMDGWIPVEKVRDILKNCCIKSANDVTYLVIGIENQSDIHYAMVVRNMLYDALNYTSQVSNYAKEHKKNHDVSGDEFLSGFAKEDKLIPVITLTLYWNAGAWDGARNLHEMFHIKDRRLLRYVSDYKLNLIVPSEISDFGKFRTELGPVLDFFACANSGKKLREALKNRGNQWESLSEDAIHLLNGCLNAKIEIKEGQTEGAGRNVCKAIEEMINEAALEAEARGEARGEQNMLQMLFALVKEGHLSVAIAAQKAKKSVEEFEKMMQDN